MTVLNTGLDDFLAWAETRQGGGALPARPADAVLTLLALRGADRRAGVPEPTPQLLHRVLHEDLPVLFEPTEEERAALPGVLTALADRVRAANRLNAKRHARLLDAVQEALPEFDRVMDAPFHLTWPRWYARLLHAAGVDTADPEAVRAWLDAYARGPRAARAPLPAGITRAHLAGRTLAARAVLTEAALEAAARDTEAPSPAGPLLPEPLTEAARPDEVERLAAELSDRWTAAGLSEALAGPYADLAPGPESLPHSDLADRMLDEHLDYYGYSGYPLPPPLTLPDPDEIRGLLHAAPLPAALAEGADDDLRELAERCGFPGPATTVWTEGTPQELTELAADILAVTVERVAAEAGPDDEYALDAAHLLYTLYERGGTADSVARKASDVAGWQVVPELEDAPVRVPDTAPDAYETPSPEDLSELLGLPGVTETDRERLDSHAHALAALIDRLAETGCVFRTGDAYGLTPLGNAVMRHVFTAGDVAAPDRETVAGWDAAETVVAVQFWPPAIAAETLTRWTADRGGTDEAWEELLNAVSATHTAAAPLLLSTLFGHLDLAGIPSGPLRTAVGDPVIGAYAHRLLEARKEAPPVEEVPLSARAVLLVSELHRFWMEDMRASLAAAAGEEEPEPGAATLAEAFDTVAAAWPGGAASLLPAMAAADPPGSLPVLRALRDVHPDGRVRDLAGHAAKAAERRLPAHSTPADRHH